jgi:hypothetical protein
MTREITLPVGKPVLSLPFMLSCTANEDTVPEQFPPILYDIVYWDIQTFYHPTHCRI